MHMTAIYFLFPELQHATESRMGVTASCW